MRYAMGTTPDHEIVRSIEPVVLQSEHVLFHPEAVKDAADRLEEQEDFPGLSWKHPCHFFDGGEETARWILVLDVLNHCFWPSPGQKTWTVIHGGRRWSGYWGLAASLNRAMERRTPVTRASWLASLEEEDLRRVFAGEGDIPLFPERLRNLREAGRILEERWGGDFVNLIEEASKSALKLVRLVVESFPGFRDQALYRGYKVNFLKRAQLLVWDLYCAFEGKSFGEFHDLEALTAFADYKLPQVLRELGVLSYDSPLAARVDRREELQPGSHEEVEIRALTLWAVEAIKEELLQRGRNLMSAQIDRGLWNLGQRDAYRRRPYHRCRTTYY
ncbi:MAG TPA: queuosine salvage family protein [Syntrophobacteraceae bacterium]|nr:queuosine salvage family protein [Syntrophobacteraceae bacterium]